MSGVAGGLHFLERPVLHATIRPDVTRSGLFAQVRSLLIVMIAMMLGNFVQIMIWGVLFICLGEFSELYEAVYHSAVNFTSLGYGDVVMSARWKLMGPLEAANGVLMFGMTSAALMAILLQLIKPQFEAGRQE
jgi:Ion channel